MVHLIPAYRQKLKLCKPVVRTSKKWTSEAVEDLQACLDCTDWDIFRSATNSLDEYADAVTSYISFCEDSCVPSRSKVIFNNNKPWFTAELRQLRLANSSSQITTQLEGSGSLEGSETAHQLQTVFPPPFH